MNEDIEVGTRVELRADRAGVYKKAIAGALGVVKKRKIDDDGFPMIYIEWEKDHWRYTGESDGWTFEEHFSPSDKTTIFAALDDPGAFAAEIAERIEEQAEDDEVSIDDIIIDNYIDRLNEVVSALSEAEGFIVLAAKQEPHPKDPDTQIVVPYVFGGFLNELTMVLLEAQLVQLGAAAQADMAQGILKRLQERQDDEDEDDEEDE